MNSKFIDSFERLKDYCEREQFMGYDPYDGLNSKLFQSIPLLPRYRFARLAWIQFFKRSPVNLRSIAGIRKAYNPKALGLFLSGYCNLYNHYRQPDYLEKIHFFSREIEAASSRGFSGSCWGYNFDWESRAFFQPKFMPTVVASSFVANALLDAYEITRDEKLLQTARSTCDFILKDLNRTYDEKGNFAFSYSPLDKTVVLNASLLAAKLLSRVFAITAEPLLAEDSKKALLFCCDLQKANGSWSYGTLPFHQWIDNFHTGYNLECIADYMKYSGDNSFHNNLERGFAYYMETFFSTDGVPRYYSNATFPIDIHAPAQLVITINKLNQWEAYGSFTDKVLNWTIDHMQSDKGFFYYQVNKYFASKIPYMRWSQAWMFYAFTTWLSKFG